MKSLKKKVRFTSFTKQHKQYYEFNDSMNKEIKEDETRSFWDLLKFK